MDHFGLIAPYYDRIFRRRDVASLAAHVAAQPSHRLLDVGGGTGRIARHFVGMVAQVFILDPSPDMLLEAQRKGEGEKGKREKAKGICIAQGLSEHMPFQTAAFDRIIVIDVFHHLIDQQRAAHEMMRVLATGGRLVVEEPDIAHWGVRLTAQAEKLLRMRSHFYSAAQVKTMFERAGGQVRIARQGHVFWAIVNKPLEV